MKNKFILDTSFISSLLKVDDDNHLKSIEKFKELPEDAELVIPITVVTELFVSKDKYVRLESIELFIKENYCSIFYFDEEYYKSIFEEYRKFSIHLKAIDFTILYVCRYLNADILTFDIKLKKEAEKKNSRMSINELKKIMVRTRDGKPIDSTKMIRKMRDSE